MADASLTTHDSHAEQPLISTANGTRQFACSAVAVAVFVVNQDGQILLLAHPRRQGAWEVVNGMLERNETILGGVLRELYEEIGAAVRVRPLGTVHTFTDAYDERVQHMVTICYLVAYEGGEIDPGDDMAGSEYRWWAPDEFVADQARLLIPTNQTWLLRRAAELYCLWHDQAPELQPPLDPRARPKSAEFD
jgi:ADP-ribose pyrophosphatase YjhB (NUDIX family)